MNEIMNPDHMVNLALVQNAVHIVAPIFNVLFAVEEPKVVWGPKYAKLVVVHPALQDPFQLAFGSTEDWDDDWPHPSGFGDVALWKAETAVKFQMPTSVLVHIMPHLLMSGDYMHEGGVCSGALGVGCSGVEGFADEIASNAVLHAIIGLAKLKKAQLRAEGLGRIGS